MWCNNMQELLNTNVAEREKMLSVEEIRRHLTWMALSRVAYETGIDRGTLIRLKGGITVNPSHSVIKALSVFLIGLRDE